MTTAEIQSAINAAEIVASPLRHDDDPVTVTNHTLLALIEGAEAWLQQVAINERLQEAHRDTGDIDD